MTTSAPLAAAAGVAAVSARLAWAKALARAPVRFQTTSSWREARCFAIGVPIAPSPRNAMRMFRVTGRRRAVGGSRSEASFRDTEGQFPTHPSVRTILRIEGMRTVHCVRAVSTALGGVAGISAAHVRIGEAELDHEGPLDAGALRQAVTVAGYVLAGAIASRTLPVREPSSD